MGKEDLCVVDIHFPYVYLALTVNYWAGQLWLEGDVKGLIVIEAKGRWKVWEAPLAKLTDEALVSEAVTGLVTSIINIIKHVINFM